MTFQKSIGVFFELGFL